MIHLGRLHALQQRHQARAIGQVAVVQEESRIRIMRIQIEVIDARGVEGRRAPDQAVDDVALVEQLLGQIGAVLAGDTRDERDLL